MATAKYEKKLKCTNVNIGAAQSMITFIEEVKQKEGAPVVRSGITVTLYLTNVKDAQQYNPGEMYTVTIH